MSSVIIAGDTSGTITLAAPAAAGSTTLTLPATSGTILQSGTAVTEAQGGTGTTTGYYGFKSRIINGAMVVDQRNAGALQTGIGNNTFIVDRFSYQRSGSGVTAVFNSQQSTTAPTGYSYSAYMTATTGQTLGASGGRYMVMRHAIEGFNLIDVLRNQSTVTLSFYAYVSNSGTYSLVFKNSSGNSSYATTYSVTTANTWQLITTTFAINTSSGTWNYTNGMGLEIFWVLDADDDVCASSNNAWVSGAGFGANGQTHGKVTTGATFYITGVQLEKGSTATSFDYRPYGTELALCQRYYYQYTGNASAQTPIASAFLASTVSAQGLLQFPVPMRAAPTQTGSAAADTEVTWSAGTSTTSALTLDLASTLNASLRITTTGLTTGQGGYFRIAIGATKYLAFSAEL